MSFRHIDNETAIFVFILVNFECSKTSDCGDNSKEEYFSFQPVLHDWCNKGCGMCYPVCGMVHIKEPLLLIGKSFLSRYLNGPLPYVQRHITVNKMC